MRKLVAALVLTVFSHNVASAQVCNIRPKVCTLQTPYNPSATTGYSPPVCASAAPYWIPDLVQRAVDLTPRSAQAELCEAERIFVDPTPFPDSESWGLWENPANLNYRNYPG